MIFPATIKTLVTLDRWWLPVEMRSLCSSAVTNTDSCRCTESPLPAHPLTPCQLLVSSVSRQRRGRGYQFFNPKRDIISDLRRELQPWRGNAASRRLLLFGPLDNAAIGSEAVAVTLIRNCTPERLFTEQAWNDGWWHSVKLSNKFGFGPKQLKFKAAINLFPNKDFRGSDSPTASVAVTATSLY